MGGSVTIKAKRDQIAFTIAARVAAKLFVVDFKVGHGTADLAPPAVSPEYVLVELLVILLLEPDRRLFRHSSIHWIFSVTNCAKACLCSPGRNLKNRESARRSTLGSPPSRFAPARKSAQLLSRQ